MIEFPSINLTVSTETKGKLPSLSFDKYKSAILGDDYELSIVFVSEGKIKKLNKTYREIDKVTDILSFPISKKAGDIFICKKYADKKSTGFDRSPANYLAFLVIHGLVHLKGFEHSSKMESIENRFRKQFDI